VIYLQLIHDDTILFIGLTGYLCGACKHDHDGVGVLTTLCQRCKESNFIFLVILGKYIYYTSSIILFI